MMENLWEAGQMKAGEEPHCSGTRGLAVRRGILLLLLRICGRAVLFCAGSVICCHLPLPQKNWEWRLLKETFSFSYMTITWTSWSFDWRLKEKLLLRLLWGIRTGHYFKTFPKQTTSSFFVLYSIEMIGVKLITWQMTCKLQNMCIGNVFRWFEFWVSYKTAVTSSEKHNRAGPLTAPSAFDRSAALFIHVPLRSAGATKRRSSPT